MDLPDRDELCRRFDGLIARLVAREPSAMAHGRSADARPAVCVVAIDEMASLVREDPDGAGAAVAEIVRRLDRLVRSADLIARIGEGEMALATTSLSPAVAGSLMERVSGAVAMPLEVGGRTVALGATIGIAFAGPQDDASSILAAAEADVERRRSQR